MSKLLNELRCTAGDWILVKLCRVYPAGSTDHRLLVQFVFEKSARLLSDLSRDRPDLVEKFAKRKGLA